MFGVTVSLILGVRADGPGKFCNRILNHGMPLDHAAPWGPVENGGVRISDVPLSMKSVRASGLRTLLSDRTH